MKKCLIIVLLLGFMLQFLVFFVNAEEYVSYQEIVFDNEDVKLLKTFTKEEYESHYLNLDKKKFMGWNLYVCNLNQPLEFVSETKLKIFNNGYSTIKHNITLTAKEETKYQISASGSIAVNIKGDVKKFKGTLDADIKASISYTKTSNTSESYEFIIIVDPGTYVSIITRGKGEINNGVAKHYIFWILSKKGGWETFTITTEYYEIIKEKL